jgi:sugar phosphate isomerase/epimerase
MESKISRRTLFAGGAALLSSAVMAREKLKVAIFSKHLQFVDGDELATTAAGLGFDGIDITVRKGGHVEPERVRQDLPRLVAAIRKAGLDVPMVTTDIADASTPFAEDVIRTASELGARYYRFGAFKYAADRPYTEQLESFKPRLAKLAALNAQYQSCAIYHTHSGAGLVGASIWDLHEIMKDLDPKSVAINYDVAHATIEGGLGGWINSFRISGPHLRGVAVKDFAWEKDAKGKWQAQWKPVGEGMVHFPEFFAMLAATPFAGPLQIHYEYPLGGAQNGTRTVTMPRAEILGAMKKDLGLIRGYLGKAGL